MKILRPKGEGEGEGEKYNTTIQPDTSGLIEEEYNIPLLYRMCTFFLFLHILLLLGSRAVLPA